MLAVTGLAKSYGEIEALRGVDLEVGKGEVVALLGRNGAGKTTLLSIVAGLLRPDSGAVLIDGVDVLTRPAEGAQRVGIAPQETGIYRVLTVRENLEFFGELAGLRRADRRRRAEEVANQLELGPLLDRRATNLSGGEARRLHTACALVHSPPLLLLDEPTVGADVGTRNQLISTVRQLADEGATVVYTTHYLPEVEALEAEIIIIDEGRMLARGTRSDLVARHFEEGVEVRFSVPKMLDDLGPLAAWHPRPVADDRWSLTGRVDLGHVLELLGPHRSDVIGIEVSRPDLEQVFLTITGSSLSDDAMSKQGAPTDRGTS